MLIFGDLCQIPSYQALHQIIIHKLSLVFCLTTYILFLQQQGWYIITYALGIYILNLFIGFLSPRIDPAITDDPGSILQEGFFAI